MFLRLTIHPNCGQRTKKGEIKFFPRLTVVLFEGLYRYSARVCHSFDRRDAEMRFSDILQRLHRLLNNSTYVRDTRQRYSLYLRYIAGKSYFKKHVETKSNDSIKFHDMNERFNKITKFRKRRAKTRVLKDYLLIYSRVKIDRKRQSDFLPP